MHGLYFSADNMKVNLNQAFKDFKGNDILVGGKAALLSEEIGKTLYMYGVESKASADEKYMAYKLCNRIMASDIVELTLDEASFIVRICGERFSAGAYGQIRELLEG